MTSLIDYDKILEAPESSCVDLIIVNCKYHMTILKPISITLGDSVPTLTPFITVAVFFLLDSGCSIERIGISLEQTG